MGLGSRNSSRSAGNGTKPAGGEHAVKLDELFCMDGDDVASYIPRPGARKIEIGVLSHVDDRRPVRAGLIIDAQREGLFHAVGHGHSQRAGETLGKMWVFVGEPERVCRGSRVGLQSP